MFPRLPSWRLGSLFGFPIRIHLSFLLLLGFVMLSMGGLVGLAMVLMVASSVLVHELGHALVARHLGVPVTGIGLHFFGGAAELQGLARRPGDEIAIAAAGPAVSFALAGSGYALASLTGVGAFGLFALVNLVLALFNLVPAFPSDGGRILRALLARKHGLVRATDIAVKVGRVACIGLAAVGLWQGSFQLVLVAIVLWTIGGVERFAARMRGDHGEWAGAAPTAVEYLPPGATAKRGDDDLPQRPPVVFVWRR
jgi:stage IV sporulation protein FB